MAAGDGRGSHRAREPGRRSIPEGAPGLQSCARFLPWLLATAALLTAAWALWVRRPPDPGAREVQQFDLTLPADVEPRADVASGAVLSPNGKIVAVTGVRNGVRSVFVRPLDREDFFELAELANGHAISPDSTQIALVDGSGHISMSRVHEG